ncbi:hypothetical protein [Saccharopolyspora kobensis]|uniref:hypothetical protein n=1 Tax=Saccharopolyspora kobensis TaxID=146035 RepID=UPI0011614367|nr:hypothetical protein [Saccharopolyspora kobensis]
MDDAVQQVCSGSLLDLFVTWWSGEEIKKCILLGWKIVFWARIGKWLQFAAGLVVVLDLLGPDRLKNLALRFRGAGWKNIRDAWSSDEEMVREESSEDRPSGKSFGRRDLVVVVSVLFVGAIMEMMAILSIPGVVEGIHSHVPSPLGLSAVVMIGLVVLTYVNGLALLLFGILATGSLIIVVLVLFFVVTGIAEIQYRALRGDPPGHPLRWVSLVLFLFGFSLDMLGS